MDNKQNKLKLKYLSVIAGGGKTTAIATQMAYQNNNYIYASCTIKLSAQVSSNLMKSGTPHKRIDGELNQSVLCTIKEFMSDAVANPKST